MIYLHNWRWSTLLSSYQTFLSHFVKATSHKSWKDGILRILCERGLGDKNCLQEKKLLTFCCTVYQVSCKQIILTKFWHYNYPFPGMTQFEENQIQKLNLFQRRFQSWKFCFASSFNFLMFHGSRPSRLQSRSLKGLSINSVTPFFQFFDPPPFPCHYSYALKITPNHHFCTFPFWGDVIYGWSIMCLRWVSRQWNTVERIQIGQFIKLSHWVPVTVVQKMLEKETIVLFFTQLYILNWNIFLCADQISIYWYDLFFWYQFDRQLFVGLEEFLKLLLHLSKLQKLGEARTMNWNFLIYFSGNIEDETNVAKLMGQL